MLSESTYKAVWQIVNQKTLRSRQDRPAFMRDKENITCMIRSSKTFPYFTKHKALKRSAQSLHD